MKQPLATLAPLACSLLVALAAPAQAALLQRPGGMVHDTQSNLTWLIDWNAAAGSAFDDGDSATDGRMSWAAASAWAAALQWGGVDDWRLPASSTCLGFNCRSSEMGALWYTTLGHAAGVTPASQAPFQQVRAAPYWTGTPLAGATGMAWYFNAQGGSQNVFPMSAQAHAVAVRMGDVALVPEPPAAAQWLAGLAGLVGVGRRLGRRSA